ncbi:TonB-dependent receptor [Saccharobesus litoralis]|uniref:TonB-dependent receptor n=1 Tax=Saccharobesus litoralis TaxID=2172099 RepID=UPI00131F1703|nr:TonB-dependent receptor [Saccharobesus litoralis]
MPFIAQGQVTSSEQELEVIQVTAQKRLQNTQEVGISLAVLSGDDIEVLQLTNTVDISQQIPNLQLNTWSPNLTIFNLRGISQNNFTDNLEAPIAVYFDDAYYANLNSISNQLFDLQRVEVLRGPQSTLFGRNATGGVIQYVTTGADVDELNGYLKIGGGQFNQQYMELASGVALTDHARGRIALKRAKSDGYIVAAQPGIRNIGGDNALAVRTSLQFDLTDDTQLNLKYSYSKDDDVPTGGYSFLPWTQAEIEQTYLPPELVAFTQNVILEGGAPPNDLSINDFTKQVFFNTDDGFTPVDQAGLTLYKGDSAEPHTHYSNINGYLNRTIQSLTAKITAQLNDRWYIESISHLQELDKAYLEDGDGIPAPIIAFQTETDYRQASQELRLDYRHDNTRLLLGAYLLDTQQEGAITTIGNPVLRLARQLQADGLIRESYNPDESSPKAVQTYNLAAQNHALFAHWEQRLSAQFEVVTGLRWSQDEKQMDYRRGFADESAQIDFIQQAFLIPSQPDGKINYQDYSAKLQFNWQPARKQLYYLSYNRGIKVGNWAMSAGLPIEEMQHKPETLHAYEAGLKLDVSPRFRVNASTFLYDYRDYQAFAMIGLAPQITNSDANISGAELELTYLATESLSIDLGLAHLHSQLDKVDAVASWQSPVGGTVIDFPRDTLTNVTLPNTPEFSLNYALNYQTPLWSGLLISQLDGVYYDDQYLEVTNGGGAFQDAYHVVNFKLTYRVANDALSFSVYGKNVTDEVYKQYNLDLGMLGSTSYYAPPASYGVSVHYQW